MNRPTRLGLLAADGGDPHSVCTPPAIKASVEPTNALESEFEDAYRRYRALYPVIRDL